MSIRTDILSSMNRELKKARLGLSFFTKGPDSSFGNNTSTDEPENWYF